MHSAARKRLLPNLLAVLFWLAIWHFASVLISEKLFLASPVDVLVTLAELLGKSDFYSAIGYSFSRTAIGFFASMLIGCALAVLAYKSKFTEVLFRPFMGFAKSAPAAAFTLIFLLIVGSKNLAVPVVFLMVMPLFYSNLLAGLKSVEPEYFEAAAVFGMIPGDRFRFIYLPFVSPHFGSACELGWGVAWKAGVSAEVIAITAGSIGGSIYNAKIHLETAEIFAYTFAIIVISLLLERLTIALIRFTEHELTKPR